MLMLLKNSPKTDDGEVNEISAVQSLRLHLQNVARKILVGAGYVGANTRGRKKAQEVVGKENGPHQVLRLCILILNYEIVLPRTSMNLRGFWYMQENV